MKEDEISVFDKAYITFSHLHTLHCSAIFWVTRAKDNLNYEIVKPLGIGNKKRIPKQVDESENTKKQTQKEKRQNNQYQVILKDIAIRLTTPASQKQYPDTLRLIEAQVQAENGRLSP